MIFRFAHRPDGEVFESGTRVVVTTPAMNVYDGSKS